MGRIDGTTRVMGVYYQTGCRRWWGRGRRRLMLHALRDRTWIIIKINDTKVLLNFILLEKSKDWIRKESVLPMNFSVKRLYVHFTVKNSKWLATIIVLFTDYFVWNVMSSQRRTIKWRHKHTSIVTSQVIEMFLRYYKNPEKINIVNLKRGQMCNVLLNLIWLSLYSSSYSLVHCLCPIFKSINF